MLEDMVVQSIINSGPWAMLTVGILIWFGKKMERVLERNTEVLGQIVIVMQHYNEDN